MRCERIDECDGSVALDCRGLLGLRACEEAAAGRRCPGGQERIEECVASIAVQPCEDVLSFILTQECEELCAEQ